MVCSTGYRGISTPAPGAPPLPPSSLILVSAELFLSHILTPLSSCCCVVWGFFFALLNYVIPEVLPPSLMGSALASSGLVLEPAGASSIGHRGSFWQLLTEATPVTASLSKPCHANPIHVFTLCISSRAVHVEGSVQESLKPRNLENHAPQPDSSSTAAAHHCR